MRRRTLHFETSTGANKNRFPIRESRPVVNAPARLTVEYLHGQTLLNHFPDGEQSSICIYKRSVLQTGPPLVRDFCHPLRGKIIRLIADDFQDVTLPVFEGR